VRGAKRRYVVAEVGEIPPGGRKIVSVAGREIGVLNVDGVLFAIRNRCPHQGAPLCKGPLLHSVEWSPPANYSRGERLLVQCPWHGWEFDLRTGQSWFDPDRWRVRRYDVEIENAPLDSSATVEGPYQAETYPVTVGERYVVIEI
jgi:nitrite reductase/ring-hydroxylating ferredoxin subunit